MKYSRYLQGFESMRPPKRNGHKGMKFHGHVKLTLHNCKNGKEEIIEGDNVVTDAVKDIMLANLVGSIDYGKIFGNEGLWKKWFGGCICYEQQHANLNAADYFMPNSADNPVTAHAGMTPIDIDHDDDTTRGQAVGAAFHREANGIRIAWEWGQEKGNGYIRALSLCHSDAGSYGIGVDSYHFRHSFSPWEQIQSSDLVALNQNPRAAGNAFVQYDDYHTLFFYIGEDGWYNANASVPDQEDMIEEVTIYVRRFPYTKAGLFDLTQGTDNPIDERKFTVQTSIGFKYNPAFYFDYENKQLWLFTNFTYAVAEPYGDIRPPHTKAREWSRNTVQYCVIDCESETEIDSGEIVSNADDLAFLECSADGGQSYRMYYGARVIQQNIMIDDGYIYLPMGESVTEAGRGWDTTQNFSGWKKINLNNQADQEKIEFVDDTVLHKYFAAVKQGELMAGFGWVMNGNVIYPCSMAPFVDQESISDKPFDNIYVNEQNLPVMYAPTRYRGEETGSTYPMPRYLFASKLLNTTKFNMDAVQKSSSQSMRVEYTLTEED